MDFSMSESSRAWVIIGLGNPEPEYSGTRHNAGRMALDALYDELKAQGAITSEWKLDKKRGSTVAEALVSDRKAILAKPETYMNLSGEKIRLFLDKNEEVYDTSRLLVVHDELDLPVGAARLAYDRGPGGNNGVRSTINHLKTKAFARLRIGISPVDEQGKPVRPVMGTDADFVLAKFPPTEKVLLNQALLRAVTAMKSVIEKGVDATMNESNRV